MTKTDRERQRKAPILRFKGFTDDWEQRKLLKVCKKEDNKRIPIKEHERKEGNTPYFGANGIQGYIDGYTHDGTNILIAEDGANNVRNYPIKLITGKIWVNNHAHVLKVNTKTNNGNFLVGAIKKINFYRYLVGSSRYKLTAESLNQVKIKIAKQSEQEKIGELLKNIEELLTLYERKTKLIKQIQSSFLDKFFFEPNNVTSLNHFLRIRNGYAFKSSKLTENGEIPVVRISNIGNDKSFAFTTKEKNKEQFALYPNDIVIALSGATAGKINQVSNKYPLYYQNQRVGFFERKNDKLDYEYLNSFLHSKKFKSQLQKTLVAGAQPNIAPKDIEKIKIPFIGYKLQQKIGQVNKYLFELQRINKSKFTLLDKIKKTLLNNMFV